MQWLSILHMLRKLTFIWDGGVTTCIEKSIKVGSQGVQEGAKAGLNVIVGLQKQTW